MNKLIDAYQTIGIVGLAKNTGKTTTLNALIAKCKHKTLALTSIGLDGEKIDQMTYLPKPRIDVHKNMIIATAARCLEESQLTYEVLETTSFQTALGAISIVKMQASGHLVVAGPTTNKDMKQLINRLKTYSDHVFIDGAFNRLTFASIESIDAIILATGASVHPVMERTIEKTLDVVKTFFLNATAHPQPSDKYKMVSAKEDAVTTYLHKDCQALVEAYKKQPFDTLFVRGAITETLCDCFIRHQMNSFRLIAENATKFLLPARYSRYLDELNITKHVTRPIHLLAVTINPESPTGNHYDADQFLSALQAKLTVPVINVKRTE